MFAEQPRQPAEDMRRPVLAGMSLARHPAARDFVTDAYAHCKFIAHTAGAEPLLEAAGLGGAVMPADDGVISLDEQSAADFIARCRQLRFWDRERAVVA